MARAPKTTGSTYLDSAEGRELTRRASQGRRNRGVPSVADQAALDDDAHRSPRGRSRLDTIWEGQ